MDDLYLGNFENGNFLDIIYLKILSTDNELNCMLGLSRYNNYQKNLFDKFKNVPKVYKICIGTIPSKQCFAPQ